MHAVTLHNCHPERSSLRTLQAAQSKDPDALNVTQTARAFQPLRRALPNQSGAPSMTGLIVMGENVNRPFRKSLPLLLLLGTPSL